ncbi:MAG: hypothetical protein ABSH16_06250 [Sedimentisphaerales bacterium]
MTEDRREKGEGRRGRQNIEDRRQMAEGPASPEGLRRGKQKNVQCQMSNIECKSKEMRER